MDEGADHDERDDEADDEADRDGTEADAAYPGEQIVTMFDEFEGGSPDHGWYCEEEAELRRGAPFDAKREAAHDGRARAAHSGDHRQALDQADADRRPD